jgi:S1-C subfamily serine protease
VVRDILLHGAVHYAYVGLDTQLERGEEGTFQVIVRGVAPQSPAAEAGIRQGDRILAIGDGSIRGPAELRDVIFFAPAGSPLTLKIQRGVDVLRISVRTVTVRRDGQAVE